MSARYLTFAQVEYLLEFCSAKTRNKSEAAMALLEVLKKADSMTPGERRRQFYLKYDESSVVTCEGKTAFYFDPTEIDLFELNERASDAF